MWPMGKFNQQPKGKESERTALRGRQESNVMKKEYRNGTYVGNIQDGLRNGLGILVMDRGELLFGNWESDRVSGECLYLSNDMRLFGKIGSKGLLEGFHVVKTIKAPFKDGNQSNVKVAMSLYGNFKSGRLFGKFIAVIQQAIYVCNATQTESDPFQFVKKVSNTSKHHLPQALRQFFPYIYTFELHGYLSSLIEAETSKARLSKFHPAIQSYPTGQSSPLSLPLTDTEDKKIFYGYSTHRFSNRSKYIEFGFVLRNEELVSTGEHSFGLPNGLCTVFEYQECIHDGLFTHGKASGFGVRYDPQGNRYVCGVFKDQDGNISRIKRWGKESGLDLTGEGTGWPFQLVSQNRAQVHMRSLYFDSGYAEISINLPYKQLQRVVTFLESPSRQRSEEPKLHLRLLPPPQTPFQNPRRYTTQTEAKELSRDQKRSPQPPSYSYNRLKQRSFQKSSNAAISNANQVSYQPDSFASGSERKDRSRVKTTVEYQEYQSLYNNFIGKGKKDEEIELNPFQFSSVKPKDSQFRSSYRTEAGEEKETRTRQQRANTMSTMLGQFKK